MDEKQLRLLAEFFESVGPSLADPNTRAMLAARADVELIPMPRELVEGLIKPGSLGGFGGFGGLVDAGASAGVGDFFGGFGRPEFGRPVDPFVNPGPLSRGFAPQPTTRFGGFGGFPGSLTAGASDGGFFDGGFGRPDFGRPVFDFDPISPLDAQIVAKARPDSVAALDGFFDNLEAGKVDKAMSFVAKDFASADGRDAGSLKESLSEFVGVTDRRRLMVKRTVGLQANRDQIATRLEIVGGARMKDGRDANLGEGMIVDVIFENAGEGWKISGISKPG